MSDLNFPAVGSRVAQVGGGTRLYNGVYKKGRSFVAKISIDGKLRCLGNFKRAKDAAVEYDQALVELTQRSLESLNFPNGGVKMGEF